MFITLNAYLINKIILEEKQILIRTNQNHDFLKTNNHRNTKEFLDLNLSSKLIPAIIWKT